MVETLLVSPSRLFCFSLRDQKEHRVGDLRARVV